MHRRINITLPEDTIRLLGRMSGKGQRSALIGRAIRRYLEEAGKASLRRRLKKGYARRARRDLETAETWFLLDEEACSAGEAANDPEARGGVLGRQPCLEDKAIILMQSWPCFSMTTRQ